MRSFEIIGRGRLLESSQTLTLPRLQHILTQNNLNGSDIVHIDDIDILRPNGSVLRVTVSYENGNNSGQAHVILSRNQENGWDAKVEKRVNKDRRSTEPVVGNTAYNGPERRQTTRR